MRASDFPSFVFFLRPSVFIAETMTLHLPLPALPQPDHRAAQASIQNTVSLNAHCGRRMPVNINGAPLSGLINLEIFLMLMSMCHQYYIAVPPRVRRENLEERPAINRYLERRHHAICNIPTQARSRDVVMSQNDQR